MKFFQSRAAILLLLVLAACGGGGAGGVFEDEDSFEGTVTVNGTTHVCKAQPPWELCVAGDCSQCQCLTGCSFSPGEPITQACSVTEVTGQDWAFETLVPQGGCIQEGPWPKTMVCSGATLHMLTDLGPSREQVLATGARFNGPSGLVWNDHKFMCQPSGAPAALPVQG